MIAVTSVSATEWRVTYGQPLAEHQASFQTLTNQGFRPICLDVDGAGTAASYSVVWTKDGFADWVCETEMTKDESQTRVAHWKTAGYRVLSLDSHSSFPDERYSIVWVKDVNAADFEVDFRDSGWSHVSSRFNAGLVATWMDVNMSGGLWVSTVYCKRPAYYYWGIGMNEATLLQKTEEYAPLAMPVVIRSHGTSYASIWLDPEWTQCKDAEIRLSQNAVDLALSMEELGQAGYEPVSISQAGGKFNSVWKSSLSLESNRITTSGRCEGRFQMSFCSKTPLNFSRFMELIPIQCSTNLINWETFATIVRTNADPAPAVCSDCRAETNGQCFFRSPSGRFITPLLTPTGPFGVGEFSVLLTDPLRWNAARGTNLQFMVTCWYPASNREGQSPAPYTGGVLASNLDYPIYLPRSMVSKLYTHSMDGAPLATNNSGPYPVILYAPGGNCHRRDNLIFVEELASHGFIVIGIDHQDTPASVYPDGTLVHGRTIAAPSVEELEAKRLEHLADARLVLDRLQQWQQTNALLAGRLDLEHTGAFGFSFGGSTAANLANTDARCRAVANLEGTYFGASLIASGCTKPLLVIRSDTPDPEFAGDNRLAVFQLSKASAYYFKLRGTRSYSFYENGFLLSTTEFNALYQTAITTDGYRAHDLARSALVSFFKRHLSGVEDGGLKKLAESPADVSLALELNGNTLSSKPRN